MYKKIEAARVNKKNKPGWYLFKMELTQWDREERDLREGGPGEEEDERVENIVICVFVVLCLSKRRKEIRVFIYGETEIVVRGVEKKRLKVERVS